VGPFYRALAVRLSGRNDCGSGNVVAVRKWDASDINNPRQVKPGREAEV
jgi:hypothetical protein